MITGLAHICFVAKDLDASLAFYRDKLGLAYAFDLKNDQGERAGIYLHAGARTFVELFQARSGQKPNAGNYRHFCLEVSDFDATVQRLRDAGVDVTGVIEGQDHAWQAWISDPDGNRIELHGYTPESWQNQWLQKAQTRQKKS